MTFGGSLHAAFSALRHFFLTRSTINIIYCLSEGNNWDYAKAVEHGTLEIKTQPQQLPPHQYPPYQALHRRVSPPPSYHPSYPGDPQRSSRFATLFEESQTLRSSPKFALSQLGSYESATNFQPSNNGRFHERESHAMHTMNNKVDRPGTSQVEVVGGTPSDRLRTPAGLLRMTDSQNTRKVPPGGFSSRLW